MIAKLVILDTDRGSASETRSGIQATNPKVFARLADEGCGKDVAFLVVHPANSFLNHYLLEPLRKRGCAVLGLNTRYAGNETFLIMERAVQDVGRGVRFLREQGYRRVCLIGNSGGASLAAFYQSQAEKPTITTAPDGQSVDLTASSLTPADGIAFVAAHPGRARVLTDRLDASVTDEADILATDPDLDIFNPRHGPPFSADFVARVRAAQLARNRRITRWCIGRLAQFAAMGPDRPLVDQPFIVHRTLADPRYLDLSLEPTGRAAATTLGTQPAADNYSPNGSARLTTLRSWLSTWSLDHTRADGPACIAQTSVPVLSVNFVQDEIIFPSDAAAYEAAIGARGARHDLHGSGHYPMGKPEIVDKVVDLLAGWSARVLA
ncbi:MAG: alpha/beta hydrolase [Betaproteobacteria bacterium]|nr:alpha/beta hydrolase [Betaproteobacteria bacterium]